MFPAAFRGRVLAWGGFRYILLEALKECPMHGYGIMKHLSEKYQGLYTPSPGIVYPTLQMFEDMGYVKSEEISGRKVYSITEEGAKYLQEGEKSIAEVRGFRKSLLGSERLRLGREARALVRLIVLNLWTLKPEAVEKVADVLEEARRKVEATLGEQLSPGKPSHR